MMTDIDFSESLSHSLVSLQVSIKSEVAASDTEARKITADIESLQTLLSNAIEKVKKAVTCMYHLDDSYITIIYLFASAKCRDQCPLPCKPS